MAASAAKSRARRARWLYLVAVAGEFRVTVLVLAALVILGAALFRVTPLGSLNGARPGIGSSVYAAWMALLGQASVGLGETWYLLVVDALFPLLGLVLVGEGLIRFGLLMLSRQRGEKEWMKVMASTYRNHVVLCGLGHLGFRILGELLESGIEVVAIERDPACRFLAQAKATGTPVFERDMKDDQALIEAGVERAHAIVIASNDDLANLEVALDARRLNPGIRVLMRLFDQQIASKISSAFAFDQVFSASALAAPVVAAMTLDLKVLASFRLEGEVHITVELEIPAGSAVAQKSSTSIEAEHGVHVLRLREPGAPRFSPAAPNAVVSAGATVIITGSLAAVRALAGAVRG